MIPTYHKIQTVFKRDPNNNFRTLLDGDFSDPAFEYLQYNEWVFTEKVDGTNIRVTFSEDGRIVFGGRTDRAQIPAFLLSFLQDTFCTYHEDLSGLTLFGEGYGEKIQKAGKNYRDGHSFVLFDVYASSGVWLERGNVEDIGNMLGIEVVPIIGTGCIGDMVSLAKMGFKSQWGDFTAEGIVARPSVELCSRTGSRVITKIKHKDFPQ